MQLQDLIAAVSVPVGHSDGHCLDGLGWGKAPGAQSSDLCGSAQVYALGRQFCMASLSHMNIVEPVMPHQKS